MAYLAARLPPFLDLRDSNLALTYAAWKRQLDVYLLASGYAEKPPKIRRAIILSVGGPQVIEAAAQFTYTEEEQDCPYALLEKLQELCTSRQNVIVARYRFWNLAYREPFRDFLCALQEHAALREFAEEDSTTRDKIGFAVPRSLRETFLREPKLTLTRAVELCIAWETSREQAAEMTAKTGEVQKVSEQRQQCRLRSHTNTPQDKHFAKQIDCKLCGKTHRIGKSYCSAFGKICSKCQKKNHFAGVCKKKIKSTLWKKMTCPRQRTTLCCIASKQTHVAG